MPGTLHCNPVAAYTRSRNHRAFQVVQVGGSHGRSFARCFTVQRVPRRHVSCCFHSLTNEKELVEYVESHCGRGQTGGRS